MGGQSNVSLLENLAGRLEMGCLSDLRYMDQSRLAVCLEAFPPESYSLWEWTDAVRYLTWAERRFSSRSEARMFLLRALQT